MSFRNHRIMVVAAAFFWFMFGLHVPVLHQLTSHDHTPDWGVLAITAALGVGAFWSLWALLRAST